jgi:hypothetical protein
MALSAWNFILRGRLQQSQDAVSMMRDSVTVLRDGQPWETAQSGSGGDGQVSVLDEELVLVVDNLEQARYGIYLLDARGETIHRAEAEATNSMLYVYLDDPSIVPDAASIVVTDLGSDELTMAPGGGTVFEARRPETDGEGAEIRVTPVEEVVEPSG